LSKECKVESIEVRGFRRGSGRNNSVIPV